MATPPFFFSFVHLQTPLTSTSLARVAILEPPSASAASVVTRATSTCLHPRLRAVEPSGVLNSHVDPNMADPCHCTCASSPRSAHHQDEVHVCILPCEGGGMRGRHQGDRYHEAGAQRSTRGVVGVLATPGPAHLPPPSMVAQQTSPAGVHLSWR